MKIFLIETDNEYDFVSKLKPYGEVVVLDSGKKDISKYRELFKDKSPKIIGVNTGIIEWKFPTAVIKKLPSLKGIASKSSWVFYLDVE